MTKVLFIDGVKFDSIVQDENHMESEVAFVSLVESLAKIGYEIVVYNNCVNQGFINNVEWKKINKNMVFEKI